MYDNIICEYPLPDIEVQEEIFQTKTFDDPQLDNYIITKEGDLLIEIREYFSIPEEERPFYNQSEWDNPLFKMVGMFGHKIIGKKHLTQFNGKINFYIGLPYSGKIDQWYEYTATFKNGRLTKLEKVVENQT